MTSAGFVTTSYTLSNTINLHSSLIVRKNFRPHPSKKVSCLQDLICYDPKTFPAQLTYFVRQITVTSVPT